MTTNDLIWLAGYLEGEGSFISGSPSAPGCPKISVSTTDEDIADRVAKLFGVKREWVNKIHCNKYHGGVSLMQSNGL